MPKEAGARIKINKLLEEAGWRFFADEHGPANILLENFVRLRPEDLDILGDDFEGAKSGSLDYLLLDERGKPLLVLEAKKESINPLSAKEQARKYALSEKCRFIILSNGNLHYFWDLERGNPELITAFPKPDSVLGYKKTEANPASIATEVVNRDYIVLTQRPGYGDDAGWKAESERPAYEHANKLRFLRDYQIRAVRSLQQAVARGKDRFLFEMATGTGKTLTEQQSSSSSSARAMCIVCCSSLTGWSWKTRPRRHSWLTWQTTIQPLSLRKIGTTGDAPIL
jgi:type I restriction enzyme R subunit